MRAFLSFFLCATSLLFAGELSIDGTTDKQQALYKAGEKITFSLTVLEDGKPAAGKKLKWTRSGDDGKTTNGDAVSSGTMPLTIATSMDTPGFVRIEVEALDDQNKPILGAQNRPVRFDGGAGVEIEKLKSIPEPADFDAFWTKQKARLAAVPMKFTKVEVPSPDPRFTVFDVKVDCAGGKPVSGYLAIPKDATPKSLPAVVSFAGYGVSSAKASPRYQTISFAINAHGIENGKEVDYYQALLNGELKRYGLDSEDYKKPENAYMNGMMLRVMRALEFVKAQPEWNGKELTASGGSQGGFQSIAAAALDKDVTKCTASAPWFSDLGGVTVGRLCSHLRPDWVEGIGYYDAVNMAKRVRCETTLSLGLGDYTCPPSGICVLYNNIRAPKKLTFTQGATHSYTPPNPRQFTLSGP